MAQHATEFEPWAMVFEPRIVFSVYGLPITQGSKKAFLSRSTGRAIAVEDNKSSLLKWRTAVRVKAIHAMGSPMMLEGPVSVRFDFTVRKPVSAPKRTRTYPSKKPDLDKLTRAICDALTQAQAYGDDGQIVDLYATKSYPGETLYALSEPGVAITVRSLQGWGQG